MKDNKQSLRSKNWILESLLEIMEKTPFKAISISNIVEKADVARLTFYRNFKSKEDIILFRVNQINENINEKIKSENVKDKSGIFNIIVDEILENKNFFKAVVKNDLDYLIIKMVRDEIYDLFRVVFSEASEYQLSFYVGGFSSVVLDWFKNNDKTDLHLIVDELM